MDNVWVYIHTKQDCGEWTMFGYIYIQSRTAVERLTSTMHLVKLDVYIHSTYTLIVFFLKCNHTTCTITLEEYNVYFVKSCKTDG